MIPLRLLLNTLCGCQVDGTVIGSCPLAGFRTSDGESQRYLVRLFNRKNIKHLLSIFKHIFSKSPDYWVNFSVTLDLKFLVNRMSSPKTRGDENDFIKCEPPDFHAATVIQVSTYRLHSTLPTQYKKHILEELQLQIIYTGSPHTTNKQ
jgi:hypothetical protein